jgi:hypothetical protein
MCIATAFTALFFTFSPIVVVAHGHKPDDQGKNKHSQSSRPHKKHHKTYPVKIKCFKFKSHAESYIGQKGWIPHTIKDGSAPISNPYQSAN